jgi:4a-hydroxytetrahydrobiopterin dehydratase
MSGLSEKKCVPCEGGVAALTQAEAEKLRAQLHADWRLSDDAKVIRRELKFKDFYRAMSFANAVAHVANIEDHHPDIEVGWGYCRVLFTTHAIKGLSENDFICASKVDRIPPI